MLELDLVRQLATMRRAQRLTGAPAAVVCWLSDHVAGSPSSSREPMGAAPPPLPSPTSELERILAQLQPSHRRVLQLRFQEGCTIQEIARAMQLSEANAKVLQYQAVRGAAALVRRKEVAQSLPDRSGPPPFTVRR